jgi:hypothetical protein
LCMLTNTTLWGRFCRTREGKVDERATLRTMVEALLPLLNTRLEFDCQLPHRHGDVLLHTVHASIKRTGERRARVCVRAHARKLARKVRGARGAHAPGHIYEEEGKPYLKLHMGWHKVQGQPLMPILVHVHRLMCWIAHGPPPLQPPPPTPPPTPPSSSTTTTTTTTTTPAPPPPPTTPPPPSTSYALHTNACQSKSNACCVHPGCLAWGSPATNMRMRATHAKRRRGVASHHIGHPSHLTPRRLALSFEEEGAGPRAASGPSCA